MNNSAIADSFSLLAKMMDINGENSFKAKSYSSAAFAIEKLPVQLQEIPLNEIEKLKGIGVSSSKKIQELLKTGTLIQLEEIIFSTPPGVVEMLKIKGIGPKKIHTIWKEMQLESVGELLYACKENRLKLFKGFGEKTQQTVIEFARQIEIITLLEFIVEEHIDNIENALQTQQGLEFIEKGTSYILYKTVIGVKVKLHGASENFIEKYIETSSSDTFLKKISEIFTSKHAAKTEEEYFSLRKLAVIPPFLREDEDIVTISQPFTNHLQPSEIKGLIHCHSNWSDGNNTIEEMAKAAMQKGMEYMAISDHSKTASYAQGLKEDQIKAQHQYINELNIKLAPFKIFKSIESDILSDGSLDYSNNILSTFDLVIASVHSNLKMTEEKAMKRLLAAIENPYTTILGHLTGRLLLSRPSYPLNFKTIIDACAANDVVIELNANPNRLDIDWREIKYALQKNVLISVNPDAHSLEGIDDIKYGVLSAQKAMLPKQKNLSSFSLAEFNTFVEARKILKNI
jgi:DNA polymerase (family 10)